MYMLDHVCMCVYMYGGGGGGIFIHNLHNSPACIPKDGATRHEYGMVYILGIRIRNNALRMRTRRGGWSRREREIKHEVSYGESKEWL